MVEAYDQYICITTPWISGIITSIFQSALFSICDGARDISSLKNWARISAISLYHRGGGVYKMHLSDFYPWIGESCLPVQAL